MPWRPPRTFAKSYAGARSKSWMKIWVGPQRRAVTRAGSNAWWQSLFGKVGAVELSSICSKKIQERPSVLCVTYENSLINSISERALLSAAWGLAGTETRFD